MIERAEQEPKSIVIKKYANRRLYNTDTSSYVTLESLAQMVKDGQDFVVQDAKSGDDITRSVLTQIIFEEEGKGQNLLPISFLRQLIRFYDDSLRGLVPGYLELSMDSFSKSQEELRSYMSNTFGDLFPLRQFEEMGRKNVSMFQNTLKMFAPGVPPQEGTSPTQADTTAARTEGTKSEDETSDLNSLKAQVEALQQQINALAQQNNSKS